MMVPGDYGNRVDSPGIMHQQATSFWKFLISMYTQRTNALTIPGGEAFERRRYQDDD
jgi:hypothetical protein